MTPQHIGSQCDALKPAIGIAARTSSTLADEYLKFLGREPGVRPQCASSEACAGGRDSSASEVISSGPWAASSSTSVASSAERA